MKDKVKGFAKRAAGLAIKIATGSIIPELIFMGIVLLFAIIVAIGVVALGDYAYDKSDSEKGESAYESA